ncbi:MAG: 30S ribosomal protein S11 [Microgenomates group bacterium GW2011_GWC1_38_14]|nr:MAG: 30S ribosomal protein S11 [Candidatus Levybacteria bacterium GW2011_GWA2_36_13]KKQ00813.1 MAG: 30S ribosomal protein S11 [Candidatus Levybacteria bacterium GW2011_GWB1_36_18]KKQ58318.1 MAG: 30S ribosomal protein S11 [Microgenomates group bacterium GW2011_GWC1_38_14]KKR15911.1 MAG: 30S ribosomal protein S11 [Candidatus Levybacteria bacterium GW2011_GWA1_39_32]OGH43853.1 MAG: 30S ribosomal protein S11 [Candidatus Levybacteria bacterium RIFCSPLOWO2_02_FULL_37_11]
MVKKATKTKSKKTNPVTENGRAYITATFNNTLVTITNNKGDTIAWSSSGASGFKGTRKSTPFAATSAVENVAKKALSLGLKSVEVFIKGPGAGRDSALRAIKSAGLSITQIADVTPIPHNGPRASKKRRV